MPLAIIAGIAFVGPAPPFPPAQRASPCSTHHIRQYEENISMNAIVIT
jgi:hypothetical protein